MYYEQDGERDKPYWVKLNVEGILEDFEIEGIVEAEELIKTDPTFLETLGISMLNMMLYAKDRNTEPILIETKDQRRLYRMLKRDVDYSYKNYFANSKNGKKGGRPKKSDVE